MSVKGTARIIFKLLLSAIILFVIELTTLAEGTWPNETVQQLNLGAHLMVLLVSVVIAVSIVYYVYSKINGGKIERTFTLKGLLIALFLAVISQLCQLGMSPWTDDQAGNDFIITNLHSSLGLILLLTILVVTPVLEEILFQGIIQGGILKNCVPWVAIGLVSIIFAFTHGDA